MPLRYRGWATATEVPVRDTAYQPLDIAVAGKPEAGPNGA